MATAARLGVAAARGTGGVGSWSIPGRYTVAATQAFVGLQSSTRPIRQNSTNIISNEPQTVQHNCKGSHRKFSTKPSNAVLPVPLRYEDTKFNSATIDVAKVDVEDTADFALKLFSTIDELRKRRKAALWLKIPVDFCHYIGVAAHYGFEFHHTKPKFLMMNMWLRDDVPNKVPQYGTHHLGVAGCVMNEQREVLLVKDKHEGAMWKFPGGLADLGEGIGEAAEREVREETGVDSTFHSVLSLRHQHDVQFGNSDMYFICRLMPKDGGALDITKCAHEIADACWMPLEQFKSETQHSMLAVVANMLEKPEERELTRSLHKSVVPGRPPYYLYQREAPP